MSNEKTPSATPKTRTVSDYFFMGYDHTGSIGYGDESWPSINGVVRCPLEVGEPHGWQRASPEQREAYDKALKDEAAAKKKAEDEAAAKKKAEDEAAAKK